MEYPTYMPDDDEYIWANFSPHGAYTDSTKKYIVKERLAAFLRVPVKSRHTIDDIVTKILVYVETHMGSYKEDTIVYFNYDKELWEALETPHNLKIKEYQLRNVISMFVDYPTPFEFEERMKADIWKF